MGAGAEQHWWCGWLGARVSGDCGPHQKAQEPVTSARWRAATGLIWTRYDDSDEWLVYNPASADIHLFSDAAHQLWVLTSGAAPLTADQLVMALFDEPGSSPSQEFIAATRESLAFMDRAGQIRAVPSE